MFEIALFEPEIPPNTGNIIRLCANTGAILHLIKPLGFEINDKQLRRAGLDYAKHVIIQEYDDFNSFRAYQLSSGKPLFLCTTKASQFHSDVSYEAKSIFLFGPETRGLPDHILNQYPDTAKLKIPMQAGSRSLNLSNAVSVILYEAYRQKNYPFLSPISS